MCKRMVEQITSTVREMIRWFGFVGWEREREERDGTRKGEYLEGQRCNWVSKG